MAATVAYALTDVSYGICDASADASNWRSALLNVISLYWGPILLLFAAIQYDLSRILQCVNILVIRQAVDAVASLHTRVC